MANYSDPYRKAAKDALFVQSASNLVAVINSFHTALDVVQMRGKELNADSRWYKDHPILHLYSAQIGFLTGAIVFSQALYDNQYKVCEYIVDDILVDGI